QVTKQGSKEKWLEDVPVIRDFPERVSFSFIRNEGVVRAIARVVGEMFYSTELVTVRSSGIVREKEGWIIPNVH
nr:hypothetical protein [Tanacetum cinerariifolium]